MPADAYTKMAHLLRRTAFGARPDEINASLKQGFEATVDRLVYYENVTEDSSLSDVPADTNGVPYDITFQSTNSGSTPTALTMDRLAGWWLDRMIKTKRPLLEMMVLFWHDHFATSFDKVSNSKYIYWQNKLVREQATGNFRTLLKAINRDPAMILWLDSALNTKTSPNENYGRELYELFTLGFENYQQGAYTEADVQQTARAFTGWRFKRNVEGTSTLSGFNGQITSPDQLVDIPPLNDTDGNNTNNSGYSSIHDYNNKSIFGVTQNFNGDDIIDLLLDHEPQRTFVAKFITKKLWEYFAYEDPETHVVDHLAAVAKRTNFNLKAVLRDMFLNVKEFYSDKAIHTQIKWPTHFVVSASRLLQASFATGNHATLNGSINSNNLRLMGQQLFWPPDVAGWVGGTEWISTSRYLSRANWANTFATNRSTTAGNTGVPIDTVLSNGGLGSTATADQVVDYFINLLIQRPLASNVRQALVDYLKKNDAGVIGTFTLDATTKNKKVRGLIHLLLSRPEFHVW